MKTRDPKVEVTGHLQFWVRMGDRSDRFEQKRARLHSLDFWVHEFDSSEEIIDGLPRPDRQVSGADQGDRIIILSQQVDFSCSKARNKTR